MNKLVQIGFIVTHLRRVPFDFAACCPKMNLRMIGAFLRKRQGISNQIEEITSLCEVMRTKPIFVNGSQGKRQRNVHFIDINEIDKNIIKKKNSPP